LVVDDTPDLREGLGEFLEMEGYVVHIAGNGQEALHQLRSGIRADLVITDVVMPVMDGMALIRALREDEQLCNIPILIFSAKPPNDPHVVNRPRTAVRFVTKPCPLENLLLSIQELTSP
jgi:CheY-like chemotaxis protein